MFDKVHFVNLNGTSLAFLEAPNQTVKSNGVLNDVLSSNKAYSEPFTLAYIFLLILLSSYSIMYHLLLIRSLIFIVLSMIVMKIRMLLIRNSRIFILEILSVLILVMMNTIDCLKQLKLMSNQERILVLKMVIIAICILVMMKKDSNLQKINAVGVKSYCILYTFIMI